MGGEKKFRPSRASGEAQLGAEEGTSRRKMEGPSRRKGLIKAARVIPIRTHMAGPKKRGEKGAEDNIISKAYGRQELDIGNNLGILKGKTSWSLVGGQPTTERAEGKTEYSSRRGGRELLRDLRERWTSVPSCGSLGGDLAPKQPVKRGDKGVTLEERL